MKDDLHAMMSLEFDQPVYSLSISVSISCQGVAFDLLDLLNPRGQVSKGGPRANVESDAFSHPLPHSFGALKLSSFLSSKARDNFIRQRTGSAVCH